MLRLRTFGAAFVERDGEMLRGAAGQRRVIALLAVLAVARDQGVSRDRVLGLLWPESDAEKARQALAQALYHTRRAVGEDDLFATGADLRLNPHVMTSDVAEFEEALDRGDLEHAAALYQGPFLEAFYVGGASEFERWASQERQRLAGRCAQALERLAVAAEATGDYLRAVDWRKRLAVLDPLNSRVARDLMVAMAAAGDRAGAIHHGRIHQELLRQELDVEPDPALVELIARLRDEPAWTPSVSTRSSRARVRDETAVAPTPPAPKASRLTARTIIAGSLLSVIVAGSIVLATRSTRPSAAEATTVSDMVVVAPFRVAGADPSLAYLHEGMIDLLVTKLTDDDAGLAADPGSVVSAWRRARLLQNPDVPRREALRIARELGAERLITGSVVGTPPRVVLNASLVGVAEGDLRAQASVEGSVDSLSALVDRLATRLLATEAGAWDRLASRTSTSLPALRAFLDGQSAYRRGSYRNAMNHFKRALEIDSAFAMAALGLSQAAERIGARAERERGLATAWLARAELTERDRVYLEALAGPEYPSLSSEHEQLLAWERAAAVTPSRAEVWHEVGERLFYDGQLLGIRNWQERAIAAFERAAELDPQFASPLQYLVQLAARDGDTTRLRELAARYLRLDSAGDLSAFVRWRSAVGTGDSARGQELRAQFRSMPTPSLNFIVLSSQFHAIEGTDAERALTVLLSRAVRGAERVDVHLGRHALALNRGRRDAAREILDDIEDLEPLSTRAARLRVLDALYAEGDSTAAASSVARLGTLDGSSERAGQRGADAMEDVCVAEQWRVWHGDTRTVRRSVGVLAGNAGRQVGGGRAAVCAALLEAIVSVRERRPDAAKRLARLDSLLMFGAGIGDMRSYVNIAAARLHEARGDLPRAVASLRRWPHMQYWARHLGAALHYEARLAIRIADTAAAARAFRHLAVLQLDLVSTVEAKESAP